MSVPTSPKQTRTGPESTVSRREKAKRKLKKYSTSEKVVEHETQTIKENSDEIDVETAKTNIRSSRNRSPRKRTDSEKKTSESSGSEKEKTRTKKRENSDKRNLKTKKSKSKRSSQTSDHKRNDIPKETVDLGDNLGDSQDYSTNNLECSIEELATSTTELNEQKLIRKRLLKRSGNIVTGNILSQKDINDFERELREDYEALSRSASCSDFSKDRNVNFQHVEEPYDSDDEGIIGWEKRRQEMYDTSSTHSYDLNKPVRSTDHRKSTSDGAEVFQDKRIKINVGGRIFETYMSTLRKYPNTLLGTMFHPRNMLLLKKKGNSSEEVFFDRNPRVFEVILDFFRTSTINRPPDVTPDMLREEMQFFQIDLPDFSFLNKRVSIELRNLEYKNLILPASEYKKITRVKLLSEHHDVLVRILDFIRQKVERKAAKGHNSSSITFYSPLHYTNYTPKDIFNVISMNEMRELLVELLRMKDFTIKETNEYSKKKATSIIGLHDQVINYDDPKYFSFHIKW